MDFTSLSDETLFLLIVRAQPEALDELYNRYHRMVFGLALGMVGDKATAEEITLDVFVRVWEKADTYRADKAKISTWIMTITRYHSIDILRRRGTRPEHQSLQLIDNLVQNSSGDHNPEQMAELAIQREKIRAALAHLPEEQKQVLGLAYFAGYTHRQISEKLDQPLGTVKTRIRLALQKLRHLLQNE